MLCIHVVMIVMLSKKSIAICHHIAVQKRLSREYYVFVRQETVTDNFLKKHSERRIEKRNISCRLPNHPTSVLPTVRGLYHSLSNNKIKDVLKTKKKMNESPMTQVFYNNNTKLIVELCLSQKIYVRIR